MPELPEVETVRLGLACHVTDLEISKVNAWHPRSIRNHLPGKSDFQKRLVGQRLGRIARRGKYLWIPVADQALVIHLGMSGQCLVLPNSTTKIRHERIRIKFTASNLDLVFVDQRTFGGMYVDELVESNTGGLIPKSVQHIALDPFDPNFDLTATAAKLRSRRTELKRALLDQRVVSGVGNIYADEALWLAKLHPRKPTGSLRTETAIGVLRAAKSVMQAALSQGGTSFDSLYVNVNGESGYFSRELKVYGQAGLPCQRCGRSIRRERFTNRYSHLCPQCQVAPRG